MIGPMTAIAISSLCQGGDSGESEVNDGEKGTPDAPPIGVRAG